MATVSLPATDVPPAAFAEALLGLTPHSGQSEWLNCRAQTKVACCGRRWGKTYSTAADLIWFAATRPDTTQFLVAPTHDQSIVLFRYVERLLREAHLKLARHLTRVVYSPFPELYLSNGSVIRARSAGNDASNIRGHGADRVVFDEAAFIPDIVYDTVSPLLATSQYGELVLISTPFGLNRFHDYWQKGQAGDPSIQSFRFPSHTNPHLSASYLEQQRRDMTQMAYAVEYGAEFHESQSSVFPWSLIQSCIGGDEHEPEHGHEYVIGYDPAKWQDRSGIVVLDITTEPWQTVGVHDLSGRDYLSQAAELRRLSATYNRARVLLDATSHDQMLEQLQADGLTVEGFKFTNESKQELLNGLVIAMEQGRIRIPNHAALIDELVHYRYELTAAGNVRLGADDKHHDDLVTALALAVQATKTGGIPFSWIRNDPGITAPPTPDEQQLTDAERVSRRIAAYYAAQEHS